MKKILFSAIFLLISCTGALELSAGRLDNLYGILSLPLHIKYYEVDDVGNVMLNPYLQVANNERRKAILDPTRSVYDWVIDAQGNVRIIEVVPHPRGRTYTGRFTRPEDGYHRERGYVERYGHVSALAGAPGRIGGEIVNDDAHKFWVINNKSGRYSRFNPDRTPEQLLHAAKLIQAVVDPGGQRWGPAIYLLQYAPSSVRRKEANNPALLYIDPTTQKRPYLVLQPTEKE
ncbi:MAG: hypothetical protein GY801_03985 [bacterium]|nr:hypothetical protein [bacterium]